MKKNLSLFLFLSGLIFNLTFFSCEQNPEITNSGSISGKAYYSNYNSTDGIVISILKDDSIIAYTQCESNGSYTFDNLEKGEYVIYAASSFSSEKHINSSVIKIDEDTEINIEDLKLTAVGNLNGTVTLDSSENGNAGFSIYIGGTSYIAKTGNNGQFTISDIPAGTDYEVYIEIGTFSKFWKKCSVAPLVNTSIGDINITTEEIKSFSLFKDDKDDDNKDPDTKSDLKLFSINYELDGGVLGDDSPIYHIYGMNTKLGSPTKDGYSFVGWYTNSDFKGRPITQLNAKSITSDIKLYALWTTGVVTNCTELNGKLTNSTNSISIVITDEYPDFNVIKTALANNPNVYVDLDLSLCNFNRIPENSFKSITNIKTVKLPANVEKIGANAFSGCRSLTQISPVNNVTNIENYAFQGCYSLSSFDISNKVENIGSYAFESCSSITELNIPETVKSIGSYAFSKTSITSLKLPSSLEIINSYLCYYCDYLTDVVLPENVERIMDFAFSYCKKLKSIELPDTVYSLGKAAFSNSSLEEIKLSKKLTSISESCFTNTNIIKIDIPNNIKSIGKYAFYGCKSLSQINIPSSVQNFGSQAFYDCSNLSYVNISDISAWCTSTFESKDGGGTILEHASSSPLTLSGKLYLNGELVTDIVIPDGVTKINSYAFVNCDSFTSVTIPPSVQKINFSAFEIVDNLTEIYISDLAAWCTCEGSPFSEYYTDFAGKIFLNGTELTSVTIPPEVTTIGSYTFYHCQNITNITLPDNLQTIGKNAFAFCKSLTSISIPDSVVQIGYYALWNCTSLSSLRINTNFKWKGTTDYNTYLARDTSTGWDPFGTKDLNIILQKFVNTYNNYGSNQTKLVNTYVYR